MARLQFRWNERKSIQNQRKHGVSFEEAQTVFYDERALLIPDPDASNDEDRFVLLGLSSKARMLVVCHCYRETDSVIRIISARKATRAEHDEYFRRGWR
ncbi:MAG: BrnT family toxin [Candidatus Dadabacteria bacterium]|nr:MAG: BrnT family toxin [Candidatus Dadabacteria bacterium]